MMTPVDGAGGLEAELPPEFELNGTILRGLYARDPASRRSLQADEPAGSKSKRKTLEAILDPGSTLLPFHFLRTGDRLGRAVVKLLRSDGAAGTGFLVAPGILLTNHHVLPDRSSAALAIVLANYEAAPPGSAQGRPASVPLDPEALFVTNAELDFTFCGVRGLDFLGSITLDRNSRNIAEAETVNIIQHPRGRPKEVALRDNLVVKADPMVVQYECSTEPGSSGSPVFNNRWEPVALHHASVRVAPAEEEPPGLDDAPRYLNEGIRISAIAIWLETAEANRADLRDQATRLRGIFGGIDPGAGFFGALGRKAHGRGGLDLVVECYRGDSDDLDLAYWDVRGSDWGSSPRLAEIARVVADMGIDLWCLVHADLGLVGSLLEHLATDFNLEYELFHEPAGRHPSVSLLYRRTKTLVVEKRAWELDHPGAAEGLPPLITVRAETRRSGPVAFQLVPVGRPPASDEAHSPYAEAVRHSIRQGLGEFDWVVVGETPVLFAPEKLHVLADSGRELLAAAADRDGAMALLTGPRSRVSRVFVSPNLRPAFGVPEALAVTGDREFPPTLTASGGNRPIAIRLCFDREPRAASVSTPDPTPPPILRQTPFSPPAHDEDLERRVRDLIAPVLARLLAEFRPDATGPG